MWLQGLINAHEQFKQTLGEADKEFQAIIALVQEVTRLAQQYGISGVNENPYTTLSAQVRLHYTHTHTSCRFIMLRVCVCVRVRVCLMCMVL